MMNIVFAVALAATGAVETIKLPPPEKDSGATVMQALKARHSERAYSGKEIPMETLSGVLWAANGFNRPDKRTNATGLNKQTIVLYVCMKSSAYRYDAKANELVKVSGEDLRPAVAGHQRVVQRGGAGQDLLDDGALGQSGGVDDGLAGAELHTAVDSVELVGIDETDEGNSVVLCRSVAAFLQANGPAAVVVDTLREQRAVTGSQQHF